MLTIQNTLNKKLGWKSLSWFQKAMTVIGPQKPISREKCFRRKKLGNSNDSNTTCSINECRISPVWKWLISKLPSLFVNSGVLWSFTFGMRHYHYLNYLYLDYYHYLSTIARLGFPKVYNPQEILNRSLYIIYNVT